MIPSTLIILSCLLLTLFGVDGLNYRAVGRCPNIKGDSAFTLKPGEKTKCISATTTEDEAETDRCAIFSHGNIHVTGKDSSFTIVKSKYNNNLRDGTFTETGPDGNLYKVIALKVFGKECNNMNLLLRCSDTVGLEEATPQVRVQADVGPLLSKACLRKAADYTQKVLGTRLKFKMIQNRKCHVQKDFCSKTNSLEDVKLNELDDNDTSLVDSVRIITDDGFDPNFIGELNYDKDDNQSPDVSGTQSAAATS